MYKCIPLIDLSEDLVNSVCIRNLLSAFTEPAAVSDIGLQSTRMTSQKRKKTTPKPLLDLTVIQF